MCYNIHLKKEAWRFVMKRSVCLILIAVLLMGVLASCAHRTEVSEKEGSLTVAVCDSYDMPVEGVTVEIREGSRVLDTVTTGKDGRASSHLLYGEYTLKIVSFPPEYEIIASSLVINFGKDSSLHVLTLKSPIQTEGTKNNPHVIDGDCTISLGAGKSAYYLIKPSGDKNTLYVPNAPSLSVKLDGKEVHTNVRGSIFYTAEGETLVLITNNGVGIDAQASLIYPMGTEKKPFTPSFGTLHTVNLSGGTVYYAFTAEKAGEYVLTGASETGAYSLKINGSERAFTASATESIKVQLMAGDEVTFTVSGEGAVSFSLFLLSDELPYQPF